MIAKTQAGTITLQLLEPLDHAEFAHDRTVQHQLPPQTIQRNAGFNHQRNVIQRIYAEPTDNARTKQHFVEKTPFIPFIGLLGLKIRRSQQLSNVVSVSFKRKKLFVVQSKHPIFSKPV